MSHRYHHANFPGNPIKQGVVNVATDVPSLPANQRKKPKKLAANASKVKANDIMSYTDDLGLMALINPTADLSAQQRSEYERGIRQYQQYLYPDNPDYGYHHDRVLRHRN